jgi:small subunit ribosomal protein S5
VVFINRVSKVVKAAALQLQRSSSSAMARPRRRGPGKANEVPTIRKGATAARKSMITVPMNKTTLAQPIVAQFGAAKVMIKPASAGTGVIAGGGVRAVMEAAGVKDVLTKSLGSANALNVVRATSRGVGLRDPKRRRAAAGGGAEG